MKTLLLFISIALLLETANCYDNWNVGNDITPLSEFLNITKIYYGEVKLINTIIAISCYDLNVNLFITKYFNTNYIQITVINNEVKLDALDFNYFTNLETRIGIIGELDCGLMQSLFNRINSNRNLERLIFKNNIVWMLYNFNVQSNMTHYYKTWFEYVNLLLSSDVVVVSVLEDSLVFGIYDFYKIGWNTDVILTEIGNNFTGRDEDNDCEYMRSVFIQFGTLANRRANMKGIYLNSAIVIAFPQLFTRLDDLSRRHIDTFARSNYPTIVALTEDLNFRLNLRQTDNFGWYRNGSFDGMMQLFEKEEIEFGALGILMRDERIPIVDWSAETHTIRACIMFRQPPLPAISNIFILPFSIDVWIGSSSLFVLVFIFILFQWLIPNTRKLLHPFDSLTFVMGAICQQGFHQSMSTISGRILVFLTFVSSLFLFTSYSANIVALLQSPSNAIRSIQDLINSPLKVLVQDTVYNHIYFDETNNTIIKELYHKKIKLNANNSFVDLYKGVAKIRTGIYAYQVEAHAAYQIISDTYGEHEKCGLKELEAFKLPHVTIPLKKHSGYKELFTQRLRWQREVGLIKREYKRWIPQKPHCQNNIGGFASVGLTECRVPFIMLGVGILVASIVCVFEILVYRFKQQKYKIHLSCLKKIKPTKVK